MLLSFEIQWDRGELEACQQNILCRFTCFFFRQTQAMWYSLQHKVNNNRTCNVKLIKNNSEGCYRGPIMSIGAQRGLWTLYLLNWITVICYHESLNQTCTYSIAEDSLASQESITQTTPKWVGWIVLWLAGELISSVTNSLSCVACICACVVSSL